MKGAVSAYPDDAALQCNIGLSYLMSKQVDEARASFLGEDWKEAKVSLTCPKCDQRISRWEVPKFIRLASIICPQCNSSLSLDKDGRAALWIPIIISVILIVISIKANNNEFISVILLFAGFVIGSFCGDKYGTLRVTPKKDEHWGRRQYLMNAIMVEWNDIQSELMVCDEQVAIDCRCRISLSHWLQGARRARIARRWSAGC